MTSFIDYLGNMSVQVLFDLLLGGTVGEGALVITTRILASLDLLLSVFAPVVAVLGFFLLSKILWWLSIMRWWWWCF